MADAALLAPWSSMSVYVPRGGDLEVLGGQADEPAGEFPRWGQVARTKRRACPAMTHMDHLLRVRHCSKCLPRIILCFVSVSGS